MSKRHFQHAMTSKRALLSGPWHARRAHLCTTIKFNTYYIFSIILDTGYPHDGRADNTAYRHDRRADKRRYPHDREIDIQMLKMSRNGYILS